MSKIRCSLRSITITALPALAVCFLPSSHAAGRLQPVHSWHLEPNSPMSDLLLATDGSFYGTTMEGGGAGLGTVFRMPSDGKLATLVQFTGKEGMKKGSHPEAGLVQGHDGNFYGTTNSGGADDAGTVFRMTPTGSLTTLVEFNRFGPINKGVRPVGKLILASDGNFYGTTNQGGDFGNTPGNPQQKGFGTIFRMTQSGVITTLVEFTGNGTRNKGRGPLAGLVEASDGNFFDTTSSGGADGRGTIYRMSPDGLLVTLVELTESGSANRGSSPHCALVEGADGSFYGTTFGGITGHGSVFKMTPAGVLTTLAEFTGFNGTGNRGSQPRGDLLKGDDGNFYGLTADGGTSQAGMVFKVTPAGVLTTLANFTGRGGSKMGSRPLAGLIKGEDGSFYGSTTWGGVYDKGTIFKISPAGVFNTVANFSFNQLGDIPLGSIVQDNDGSFYGTTAQGGINDQGTIYRISPDGTRSVLVNFSGFGTTNKGKNPQGGLVRGSDGNFYGTTSLGGTQSPALVTKGTIFRMTPSGVLTTLVEFTDIVEPNTGAFPAAGLIQARDGNFYGTTEAGALGFGTIFKMTPAGVLTTLVKFTGNGTKNKGANPKAALLQGADGNFYGTTQKGGAANTGTAFKMTPGGLLTTLVEFNFSLGHGTQPVASLVQGSGDTLYGTTTFGGSHGCGTVFKLTYSGTLTNLIHFSGNGIQNKGAFPRTSLLVGNDGFFYGSTTEGGKNNTGTIFRMTPTGIFTTLVHFRPWPSVMGSYPNTTLINGTDNHLYGTTEEGGIGNAGILFRVILGPTAVTSPAVALTPTTSTMIGRVNPRGLPTNVSFEYGLSPTLADSTSIFFGTIPAGSSFVDINLPVTGLHPNRAYYYRLVGQNTANPLPQYGAIRAFRTPR